MKKTAQLRGLLESPGLEFLMEAHNGLSARIAEEAGFKGIWASGLSISASQAVRDNNELSWTQVLDIVEYMSDATTIPILLDGDTGYGNFNNMRRLVKKLEQHGIAGVCIEDKLFPKTNSFLRSTQQPLADIDEFCGKIKAGKDSQTDADFVIVARVEAFIAGWGLEEALERAEHYHQAGADAILIHSKLSKPDEIVAFAKHWNNRCPLVIVPTRYYSTPAQVFREHGISVVIWANHLMRSALTAMQKTAALIHSTESLIRVEDAVAPLAEVFRLQHDEELQHAEREYLKSDHHREINAVILAASRGEELQAITADIPKALVPVDGKPIVARTVDVLRERGIDNITIVRGYQKERFTISHVRYVDNDSYVNSGELVSLYAAKEQIAGTCIVSYGDILFRKYILSALLDERGDIVVVVDGSKRYSESTSKNDYVFCSRPFTQGYDDSPVLLRRVRVLSTEHDTAAPDGEWIGLMKCSGRGSELLLRKLEQLSQEPIFFKMNIDRLLNELTKDDIPVHVLYIEGNWLDVDTMQDYARTTFY